MRVDAVDQRLVACFLVPLVAVVLAAATIWSGLGPESLYLDDEWVGIALRETGLGERLGLHLPMPVGFAALAGLPGAVIQSPHLALQVLPALAYLASVALFPVLVYRLTRNAWAAALGAAVLLSAPLTAAFAVRVKHYTLDQLVTVGVLLVMVPLFRSERPRRFALWTALLALGVVLSFSSVFLSVAALCTACGATWLRDRDTSDRLAVTAVTGAYLAAVGAFFLLYVRDASRPIMVEFWNDFFPGPGVSGAVAFLSQRVSGFLTAALPSWAALFTVLAPLGLVWLWRSGRRAYCVTLVGFYVVVLSAAVVRAYPMGTGRTDIYAFAVTTLLVCLGAVLILEALGNRLVRGAVYAALIALFTLSSALSPGVRYPAFADRLVVEWTLQRLTPDDALVLSPYAVFALEYYAEVPAELVPADYYGHGFDIVPERPRTFTSALGRWDLRDAEAAAAAQGGLDAFVQAGGRRLMYLETYGTPDTRTQVMSTILADGYRLVDGTSFGGSAEAFLFERRASAE